MYITQLYKNDLRLEKFMNECRSRNFHNNSTIKDIKFDYFDYSAFFGLIYNDNIKLFSGVHNFDYNNERFWRVGFRSVSLYDNEFKPRLSRHWRKSSINIGALYTLQMKWVEAQFGPSKFIVTSNVPGKSQDTAGASHLVDKALKNGRITGTRLLFEEIEYLYTIQNVWLLDQNFWYRDYEQYHKNIKVVVEH